MGIVFNISQNEKKLRTLLMTVPSVHPSTRQPVQPVKLGAKRLAVRLALDPEGRL